MNEFKTFCNLLENMKNPKEARNQISDYLVDLSPEDQIIACNFMLGKPLENDAVGYNKKMVLNTIKEYYYIKDGKYKTPGDMFTDEVDNQTTMINSLQSVFNMYNDLSEHGKDKKNRLRGCLIILDDLEKKYFINILLNKLRVRIGINVLSWSLAEIYDVDNKYVNNLYKKYESITDVIRILNGGSDELVIGKPVKPQLCKDISKDMNRIKYPIYAEKKYDGSRAQVHVHHNGKIEIFSRSLKNKTESFLDVIELLKENNIPPGIYDAETYGINPDGKPMSFNKFQHRINNVKSIDIDKYPVTIKLFDILVCNHKDITQLYTQDIRTQKIKELVPNLASNGKIIYNEEELLQYHKECVDLGYEGIVLKNLKGYYDCGVGKSQWNEWFKFKPSVINCDVVITGASFGSGSNLNVLSSFEIAVLDDTPNIDNYSTDDSQIRLRSVGSCGSGFDRETLELLTERIMKSCNNKLEEYNCLETPIIIEVNPQEITINESGNFGMRFPVYIGERTDKNILDIDSIEMINQYII